MRTVGDTKDEFLGFVCGVGGELHLGSDAERMTGLADDRGPQPESLRHGDYGDVAWSCDAADESDAVAALPFESAARAYRAQ